MNCIAFAVLTNRYGHPHREVLERLEQTESIILQTAERGAVTVYIRNGKMRVETFLTATEDIEK